MRKNAKNHQKQVKIRGEKTGMREHEKLRRNMKCYVNSKIDKNISVNRIRNVKMPKNTERTCEKHNFNSIFVNLNFRVFFLNQLIAAVLCYNFEWNRVFCDFSDLLKKNGCIECYRSVSFKHENILMLQFKNVFSESDNLIFQPKLILSVL